MLVMFVLITIFFYDLGYSETEKRKATLEETNTPSVAPQENNFETNVE